MKGEIIMLKKYKKRIITALMCFVIAIILTWIAPNKTICNTARAAETDTEEFNSASGKSGDLEWKITSEGHLTIEGIGDYARDYVYIYNGYNLWLSSS